MREFLDNVFEGKWLERRGSIECPARSPNLTPFDFFWGYLESKVSINRPQNVDNITSKIEEVQYYQGRSVISLAVVSR